MRDRFVGFLKHNVLVFMFLILSIIVELASLCFVGCKPYLTMPYYGILLLALIASFCFVFKNFHLKYAVCLFLLLLQGAMEIGFAYLYDLNGTFFEWSMFSQRNGAAGTIEGFAFRPWLIAIVCAAVLIYIIEIIVFASKYKKEYKENGYMTKGRTRVAYAFLSFIFAIIMVLTPTIAAIQTNKKSYVDRYLYSSGENRYQQMGISSNAVYELFNGTIKQSLIKYDTKGVKEFLENEGAPALDTSEYFGVSKGNNLVYVMVESFEWYPFLTSCDPKQSEVLYPHLNEFFKDSIHADNFYAREESDTAGVLALLGSNPTDVFANYDMSDNSYPYSLPNLYKHSAEEQSKNLVQAKSFYSQNGDKYNRNKFHKSLGFEDLVDYNDMKEFDVQNSQYAGEQVLDSDVMAKMIDQILPSTEENENFFTYWITNSMSGDYNYRKSLESKGYYQKMDEIEAYPKGDKNQNYLRTYAAAVMDFDVALGMMMDKLEEQKQLENTTIILFADHNSYSNNLSGYAKNINEQYNSELFRVPFMIYDKKLKSKYEANEHTTSISKFTTTADMLPTILDIFGIKGYKNLYLGSSMLIKDVESIIYSRAYRIFVTDKLMCYSVNNLLYKTEGFTKEDKEDFIARAKVHLNRLEYIDKIFHTDYFAHKIYNYL